MKKILVCQHVAYELLGTLNPLIKHHGFRIKYANFGRHPHEKHDLDSYDGLVVLGGPMNVDETDTHPHLDHEIGLIQIAIERKIPVLGICLGAQLIAKALGAAVERNPVREIGWYDLCLTDAGRKDPLFAHFGPVEKMFQWHGDTFAIPQGAVHLAVSPRCSHQAFRYHDNVYGLQFHLEVDEPMIHRWLKIGVHRKEISGEQVTAIVTETPQHMARLQVLSRVGFEKWLGLFGTPKKFKRLASR